MMSPLTDRISLEELVSAHELEHNKDVSVSDITIEMLMKEYAKDDLEGSDRMSSAAYFEERAALARSAAALARAEVTRHTFYWSILFLIHELHLNIENRM